MGSPRIAALPERPSGQRRTVRLLSLLGVIAVACSCVVVAGRAPGTLLVVEDTLEPAAAIVVLAGGYPGREREAAALYRAGLAPKVILTKESQNLEAWWRAEGRRTTSDLQRAVLTENGVPASAIVVSDGEAVATLDEMKLVRRALQDDDTPVILVTSAYHTRRVRMTWQYVADGHPRGIVRATRYEVFDAAHWWQDRRWVRAVFREYVGLLDGWIGFPIATRLATPDRVASSR